MVAISTDDVQVYKVTSLATAQASFFCGSLKEKLKAAVLCPPQLEVQ